LDAILRFEAKNGFWVARMPTRRGEIEVLVGNSGHGPNPAHLAALEPYFLRATELTTTTRRKLAFPVLYRLIRVAVNAQGRVGLQFRNRLTGAQPLVFIDG